MQVSDIALQELHHEIHTDFFSAEREVGVVQLGAVVNAEALDRRDRAREDPVRGGSLVAAVRRQGQIGARPEAAADKRTALHPVAPVDRRTAAEVQPGPGIVDVEAGRPIRIEQIGVVEQEVGAVLVGDVGIGLGAGRDHPFGQRLEDDGGVAVLLDQGIAEVDAGLGQEATDRDRRRGHGVGRRRRRVGDVVDVAAEGAEGLDADAVRQGEGSAPVRLAGRPAAVHARQRGIVHLDIAAQHHGAADQDQPAAEDRAIGLVAPLDQGGHHRHGLVDVVHPQALEVQGRDREVGVLVLADGVDLRQQPP